MGIKDLRGLPSTCQIFNAFFYWKFQKIIWKRAGTAKIDLDSRKSMNKFVFGNEPIGTALLWPPVLLILITAPRTSGRASLDSRAQRALYTNQGSRPIGTICASNHGSSHVVFSLGGSGMLSPLSPSCRLTGAAINTYRWFNGLITSVERSRPVSKYIYRII